MERRILRESDLWPFTKTCGVITIFFILIGLTQVFVEKNTKDLFGTIVAGFIPLVLTLICAFTDRSQAFELDQQKSYPGRPVYHRLHETSKPQPTSQSDFPVESTPKS